MVIYELKCSHGHVFEGWFKDAKSFQSQKKRKLVQCSHCGVSDVVRIPSGCNLGSSKKSTINKKVVDTQTNQSKRQNQDLDFVTFIKATEKFVKENFKDVGSKFADQAIEMKKGLRQDQPIYGTATKEDRDRLKEEEVGFIDLPKLPDSYNN